MAQWITTENIPAEAWRRVLEYANLDFAISAISVLHGSAVNKNLKQNYKKQAEQIRVAILQSKEYFDAVSTSSLFTSPNHLYYGMVSLASAIMLLIGNGDKALDLLRKVPSNRHHGLNFSTNVSNASCYDGLRILDDSYVEVLRKGFFANWYDILPSKHDIYAIVETRKGNITSIRRCSEGYERLLTSDQIVGKKYSLIRLFARLPDVYDNLVRYGYPVSASRSNFEMFFNKSNNTTTYKWRIHGAPNPTALEAILEKFKSDLSSIPYWNCSNYDNQTWCIVEFTFKDPHVKFEWPSMRENINNDQILYESYLDTHEIVDAYMAAYTLSMLSRYYPDYWIRCLESHCMAAKAIEHFVFVMTKKFPVLALKLLTADDFVISTHKPPWHYG